MLEATSLGSQCERECNTEEWWPKVLDEMLNFSRVPSEHSAVSINFGKSMWERDAVGVQREWSGEQFAFAAEQGIIQRLKTTNIYYCSGTQIL